MCVCPRIVFFKYSWIHKSPGYIAKIQPAGLSEV